MVTPTPNTPEWTDGPWEICPAKTVEDEFMIVAGEGHDHGLVAVVRTLEDARLTAASPALYAALETMVETYWRGSEDSSDAKAPRCVKLALAALNAANPARGK